MNLKLTQLLLIGIFLVVIVSLGSKFFSKDPLITTNKLQIEDVKDFVENLPNSVFVSPPETNTLEIVGIQQKDDVAVIYVRHRVIADRKLVTTPIEIVRLDSGRWYSKQVSKFITE